MGEHPLIDLALERETRQVKGFRKVASEQTGERLAELYRAEREAAPRRREAGKPALPGHDGQIADPSPKPVTHVHLSVALLLHCQGRGEGLSLPGGWTLDLVDALVPTKASRSDKGLHEIPLVGVDPDGRVAVVETLYVSPEAARGSAGDNPVRRLLEGLAYTAIVQANLAAIAEEAEQKLGRPVSAESSPSLVLLGNTAYWESWRRRESQRGAPWIKELERIANELREVMDLQIRFLGMGDPRLAWEEGRPVVQGEPLSLVQAWEAGAGRVRPRAKPRPKQRREPEDTVVEADLSRPVRSYRITESYEAGDRIEHPTLGTGVVQGVAGRGKIHVLFDGKKSLLVHERPSPSGATSMASSEHS